MSVFVSQVLISFIIECRGIPKLKIVLASDYAPPPPPSRPKSVQLYTYQKLQQRYHIDRGGGNSGGLRLQRALLQREQWQAELWGRCNVSGEQVKVPPPEWRIITIMCSTNILHYAGWLLHNGSALLWMAASRDSSSSSPLLAGWPSVSALCTSFSDHCWCCNSWILPVWRIKAHEIFSLVKTMMSLWWLLHPAPCRLRDPASRLSWRESSFLTTMSQNQSSQTTDFFSQDVVNQLFDILDQWVVAPKQLCSINVLKKTLLT